MAKTAQQLIRELAYRVNGLVVATTTAAGAVTTVIDTGLRKEFPVDGLSDKWVPWVYCTQVATPITVTITDPTGTGASAVATVGPLGTVTAITVVSGGSGYSISPTATVTGTGSGCTTGVTVVNGVITQITVVNAGSDYRDANLLAAYQEQRAKQWVATTATATLFSPGFPVATGFGDTFELHNRVRRSRILEAINDGVRRVGLYWYREFLDESVETVESTWKYTLPASQNWSSVHKVEIESTTDSTLTTHPYEDAKYLNYRVYKDVSAVGTEVWRIQFATQPPSGRTLRIWGTGYFTDMVYDTDILAISGSWQGSALAWILDWGKYRIEDEISERVAFSDTDKIRIKAQDQLMRALDILKREAPAFKPSQIVIPGVGTGQLEGGTFRDSGWLGLLRSVADHAPS